MPGCCHVPVVFGEALPGQRPAAGLVADVVGVAAGDVDVRVPLQRQRVPGVLQQHLRLATACAGDGAVRGGTDLADVRAVGVRVLEQPEFELLGQDPGDRVVDPRLRDFVWRSPV